jgi:hypothetical protein
MVPVGVRKPFGKRSETVRLSRVVPLGGARHGLLFPGLFPLTLSAYRAGRKSPNFILDGAPQPLRRVVISANAPRPCLRTPSEPFPAPTLPPVSPHDGGVGPGDTGEGETDSERMCGRQLPMGRYGAAVEMCSTRNTDWPTALVPRRPHYGLPINGGRLGNAEGSRGCQVGDECGDGEPRHGAGYSGSARRRRERGLLPDRHCR